MGTAVGSVAVSVVRRGVVVDYDRYISQRGLEHLRAKLPNLRDQVEKVKQTISDLARERELTARYDELRRLSRLETDVEEIERVLSDPIVIDDCVEYQELPEGQVWFGCGVSYVDDFGSGYIAVLNKLEREVLHQHQLAEASDDSVVTCGCNTECLQALLGRHVGDEVVYDTRGKTQRLTILAVTPLLGC